MALTSLTTEGWKATFKNVGRMTMMYNIISGDQPLFQSGVVITTRRLAEEDYDLVSSTISTFVNNMNTLSSNLGSGKTNVQNSLTSLITGPIKSDINSTATTVSGVLNDMFTVMRTDGVAVSGAGGLFTAMLNNVYGFHTHFFPTYDGGTHVSPDAGAVTLPIYDPYAAYTWADWE